MNGIEWFSDLQDEVDLAQLRFAALVSERDRLRAVVEAARAHVVAEDYPSDLETFERLVTALAQLNVSPDTGDKDPGGTPRD